MNDTMAREIRAQANILPALILDLAASAAAVPAPSGRIFAGGCGDSAFAPAALAGLFADHGLELLPRTAMELASFTRLRNDDTALLISISGSTRRTVAAAETARAAGATVVAITCNAESPLAALSQVPLILPYQPLSRRTPHTLDYTVTLAALAALAAAWTRAGPPSGFGRLPALLPSAGAKAAALAEGLEPATRIFFLGGGPDLATAAYAAAKFHEAGGLPAIAAETENFLHGMNFMLEPGDRLIAIATSGPCRARQIVDAYASLPVHTALIAPEDQDPLVRLLYATLVVQCLCLEVTSRGGLDVEAARAGRPLGKTHLAIQSDLLSR